MSHVPKSNTFKGFLNKVHAKVPEKSHATSKTLHSNLKGVGRVKPGKVDKKAAKDNTKILEHARRSSENLHKMGASPVASAATGSVAGRSLDAMKAALLGSKVITTAAAVLDILVKMHAESPGKAASELQLAALPHLKPDKGKVIG